VAEDGCYTDMFQIQILVALPSTFVFGCKKQEVSIAMFVVCQYVRYMNVLLNGPLGVLV
jgi:hypothetical protein